MKLNVKAFALTSGLLWGFGIFFLTWWLILFNGVTKRRFFIGHVYRGYRVSPVGSLVGLIWALLDGLAGGYLFARLYNAIDSEE